MLTTEHSTLNAMQQAMLAATRRGGGGRPYLQQFQWKLQPVAEPERLFEAVRRVWGAHEAFHLRVREDGDGGFTLESRDQPQFQLAFEDLRGHEPGSANGTLKAFLEADYRKGLDPARELLCRGTLFALPGGVAHLVWTSHHLLLDGRSRAILMEAIVTAYRDGGADAGGPAPTAYPATLTSDDAASEAFWRKTIAAKGPFLALDPDRLPEAPADDACSFGEVRRELEPSLVTRISASDEVLEATPHAFFQAGWAVVLSRLLGEDTVAFAAPRACRRTAGRNETRRVGLLMNTVPVVLELDRDESAGALIARAREQWVAMRPHERFFVGPLIAERGEALFETMLAFETVDPEVLAWPQAPELSSWSRLRAHTELPLVAQVFWGQRPRISVIHDERRFSASTVDALIDGLLEVLAQCAEAPDQPLRALALRAPENEPETTADAPWRACNSVPERFARVAERYPGNLAVRGGSETLTYQRVDTLSDRMAARLQDEFDLAPGGRVVLLTRRDYRSPVLFLAVLKAGGAYAPLSPDEPRERLREMLGQLEPSLILAGDTAASEAAGTDAPVVLVDTFWQASREEPAAAPRVPVLEPASPAYLVFTSGSTGRPKAVLVPHLGVLRLVLGQNYAAFGPERAFLHASALNFDATTFEVWAPLLHGGCCVVYEEARADLSLLADTIRQGEVDTAWITAALFNVIVHEFPEVLEGLREVLVGGEALTPAIVARAQRHHPNTRFINGYGPTENTTFSTCHAIEALEEVPVSIPIGRPLAGTEAHVLDVWEQPLPPGLAGQLYLGGDGLATGYWRHPELTAERFREIAIGGRARRLYQTGDRVVERSGGAFDFLGRLDGQAKIRGFRVEAGEIQAQLLALSGVSQGVVRFVREQETRIIAYVVPEPGVVLEPETLRQRLSERLPAYMVPHALRVLDALPLTRNGKVDTDSLPLPRAGEGVSGAGADPVRHFEALWAEIFHADPFDWDVSFIASGGDSLAAMRFIQRIARAFGSQLSLDSLYRSNTPRAFFGVLRMAAGGEPTLAEAAPEASAQPRERPSRRPASDYLSEKFERSLKAGGRSDGTIARAFTIDGALDEPSLRAAFHAVVNAHEVLRTRLEQVDGTVWEVVEPEVDVPWEVLDLTQLPAGQARARAQERFEAEGGIQPHLGLAPMMKVTLLRLPENVHVLIVSFCHLVIDGTSLQRFWADLESAYARAMRGEVPAPGVEGTTFHEGNEERNQILDTAFGHELRTFWEERFADLRPFRLPQQAAARLPLFSPGVVRHFVFEPSLREAVNACCAARGVSQIILFQAAWQTLIAHWQGGGHNDIVVITNARPRIDDDPPFGDFSGLVVVRLAASAQATLASLLECSRRELYDALRLRLTRPNDLPQPEPSQCTINEHPALGFCLVDESEERPFTLPGTRAGELPRRAFNAVWRLHVTLKRSPNRLAFSTIHAHELYPPGLVDRLLLDFERTLKTFVEHPEMTFTQYRDALGRPGVPLLPSEAEWSRCALREV